MGEIQTALRYLSLGQDRIEKTIQEKFLGVTRDIEAHKQDDIERFEAVTVKIEVNTKKIEDATGIIQKWGGAITLAIFLVGVIVETIRVFK